MPTVTERLAIVVEANAGQAIASFKKLGNATKGLSGDVGKAGGLLSNIGGQFGGLASAAGPAAAVGVIGAALAKFTASGVTGFISLASEVAAFKRVAGGTAEDSSRLVAAFKAVGVDAETAASGVFMLEKKLAASADKLAKFGVVAIKDRKGNTDMSQTLLSVGDAYKNLSDPVQRAALLTAAFGRQGAALVPLLGKSREEIEAFFESAGKHGQILSDDDLKKAREYKLAMRELGEAFKGLQREAGQALVPFITDVAHSITGVLELIGKTQEFLNIKPGDTGGAGGWLDDMIQFPWEGEKEKIDKTTGATHSLGDAFAEMIPITDGFRAATEEEEKALTTLDKALQGAVDADRALVASRTQLGDAEKALSELQKKSAVDTEKVADAQRSLSEATRSTGHAQREQAKAQDEYNKALAAANILGTDTARDKLRDATDGLADANDSLASAQERQKESQKDLDKAKAGDPDYQDKLATATRAVAAAKTEVSEKALAAGRAADTEAKALKDNADQVERLIGLYDGLIQRYPEAQAALSPLLAILGANAPPAAPAPPPPPPPTPAGASINSGGTNKNVTINVNSDRQIDPTHLSRTIIWEMN